MLWKTKKSAAKPSSFDKYHGDLQDALKAGPPTEECAETVDAPISAVAGAQEGATAPMTADPARNGPYRDRRGIVTRMHDVSDDTVLERSLALLS